MKVLIIDDSALMRRTLSGILSEIPDTEIRTARDGRDGLNKLQDWQPDVITLDINMPEMDGLSCLAEIMVSRPTPVVMVSSLTHHGALASFEALEMGAVDLVAKPDGTVSHSLSSLAEDIRHKVCAAAGSTPARESRPAPVRKKPPVPARPSTVRDTAAVAGIAAEKLVVIGISTGGPGTLEPVLRLLPASFPLPVVVVQHMPGVFTQAFAQRLNKICPLEVTEADRMTPVAAGHVYIARGDRDITISRRDGRLVLLSTPADPAFTWHPSVSKFLQSALRNCAPDSLIPVMMTGMGNDGAAEMSRIFQAGGTVIAQQPDSCVVSSMPESIINQHAVSTVVTPEELPACLMTLAEHTEMSREAAWH